MSAERFVLARHGRYIVIAAPDTTESPGTWLCELWEPGGPETHLPPHKAGQDGTWALARKRKQHTQHTRAPDQRTGESSACRAVRIIREICPYLGEPKRGGSPRSFQWNGRLRTLARPRQELERKGQESTSDCGDGGGSGNVDVGPGGLAALKPENQP